MLAVPHARAATCHLSHSYLDGACLYFTFAATPPPDEIESTYVALWDAGQRAVLAAGGNLSHHHGVGLNRAASWPRRWARRSPCCSRVKDALDPNGILNPGKLGLRSPFGEVAVAVSDNCDSHALRRARASRSCSPCRSSSVLGSLAEHDDTSSPWIVRALARRARRVRRSARVWRRGCRRGTAARARHRLRGRHVSSSRKACSSSSG